LIFICFSARSSGSALEQTSQNRPVCWFWTAFGRKSCKSANNVNFVSQWTCWDSEHWSTYLRWRPASCCARWELQARCVGLHPLQLQESYGVEARALCCTQCWSAENKFL
jgi:hypothetical protein